MAVTNAVVPGKPTLSHFYTDILPGSSNPMPPNTTGASASQSQIVFDWISLGAPDTPPNALSYGGSSFSYTVNTTISPLTPQSSGGNVISYSVTPALPAGLALNSTTGVISGTPTAAVNAASYVVSAKNSGGTATVTLSIAVSVPPPSQLTYSTSPANYSVGVAIPNNVPAHSGGMITTYSVNPALPKGLTLNATSGIISGTPTAVAAKANYIITGTNGINSTSATLSITVVSNVSAPAGLTYSANPAVYQVGSAITANNPSTSSGSAATSYSISPAAPSGLIFSTSTGIISGTPTAPLVMTPYQITASNSAGSTSVVLDITIKDIAPTALNYSTPSAVYGKGSAITPNSPSNSGGAVVTYTSATLPAGLAMNASTGVISGSPTAATVPGNYMVTAMNSGGSTTFNLFLGVADPNDVNGNFNFIKTTILMPKCVACHTSGSGYAGANDFNTYSGLMTAINSKNVLGSALYQRLAPAATSLMPPGGPYIGNTNLLAVIDFIYAGAPAPAPSPSASATPSPSPSSSGGTGSNVLYETSDTIFRIGNRNFIASTLQNIFGTYATTAIQNLILNTGNISDFGGPCNGYSSTNEVVGTSCDVHSSTQAASVPISITAREALRTRACDQIMYQDGAVLNALSLALGSTITSSTVSAPTSAGIAKVYDLFYTGRPTDPASMASLQAVATAGASAIESWRFVMVTLCYAPDWQVP